MSTQRIPEQTVRELEARVRELYPILARIRRGMAAFIDVVAAGLADGGRGWH